MPGPTPAELIAQLKDAFPRQKIEPANLRVYLRELADIPPDALAVAVRQLIRTSEFFPSVRAIREAAVERHLGLPGEADALAQIAAMSAWARQAEDDRGDPPAVHPLVAEAVRHVGGYVAFRTADEPGVVRGQFARLYREIRTRAILDAQVGDVALPAGRPRRELAG